ncbi:MAG: hypothetical protein M0Z67_03055 [Nitrospiraceae bacterium]|nr:hypothetical protein [Nitrospiraceae bacterium]
MSLGYTPSGDGIDPYREEGTAVHAPGRLFFICLEVISPVSLIAFYPAFMFLLVIATAAGVVAIVYLPAGPFPLHIDRQEGQFFPVFFLDEIVCLVVPEFVVGRRLHRKKGPYQGAMFQNGDRVIVVLQRHGFPVFDKSPFKFQAETGEFLANGLEHLFDAVFCIKVVIDLLQFCILEMLSIVQQKENSIGAEAYDKKGEDKNGKHRPTPPFLCHQIDTLKTYYAKVGDKN